MVTLNNVYKSLGSREILKGVSFTLPEHSVTGLLGPNGAGKSTTMKTIATLLAPDQGSVSVCGLDSVAEAERVRELIGYLPETPPLYSELRVAEYLDVVGQLRGFGTKERKERTERALERCKLQEVSRRVISHLSKGYQQRVGIAQAIYHSPKVLILDEPTSGLDPIQIEHVRELIQELSKESTLLFSSHILPEIVANCSRVILLLSGEVTWQGEEVRLAELEERFAKGVVG